MLFAFLLAPRRLTGECAQRSCALQVPSRAAINGTGSVEPGRARDVVAPSDFLLRNEGSDTMGRYALLWLLGVPIPILLLIYLFGGLH
jgi:hypothetical protein